MPHVVSAPLDPDLLVQRYEALLQISDAISAERELPRLFEGLSRLLPRVVSFDLLAVVLHDPAQARDRVIVLESAFESALADALSRLDVSIEDSPAGLVLESQRAFVVSDCTREDRFPVVTSMVRQHGVQSYGLLPLTTARHRVGVIGFGARQAGAYEATDLEFLQRVANQVAVAVDNALAHEHVELHHEQLATERDRWRALLEINNALVSNLEVPQLFDAIAACLRQVIRYDFASLAVQEAGADDMCVYGADPSSPGALGGDLDVLRRIPLAGSAPGLAFTTRQPVVVDRPDPVQFPSAFTRRLYELGVRSSCCIPLVTPHRTVGTLNLGSREEGHFGRADVDLLIQVGQQVAIAVENALAFQQIESLNAKLAEEKLYLEDEIRSRYDFEEIVGESAALQQVLAHVETVAPTESTVLIFGETGTGKELVARALHELSARRHRTLVKVNCAAIPSGLLESELFGHERGAFTGAIEQKVGRFELAHQGTLFLDEVGDIPLELQPKLLRVLQEREFERLGSSRSIRVDVRLVAATNRDLAKMVADRQFRSDLFYRLHVFPIVVPPLRERRGDIPLLVRYFAQKYARRMKRQIQTIPTETLEALCRWPWPGNVRELENVVERAVILSRGPVLEVPVTEVLRGDAGASAATHLNAIERDHIVRMLDSSEWVIGGPRGAAARLGLKRTTLTSRMRKLGIRRPR